MTATVGWCKLHDRWMDTSGRWYTEGEIRATQFSNPLINAQTQTIRELREKVERLQAQLDRCDTAANDRQAG